MIPIVFVSLVMLLSAIYSRKLVGSWMHPAALLMLLWSFVFVTTSIFAPDYYFSVPAGLLLYVLIINFALGGLVGTYSAKRDFRRNEAVTGLTFKIKGLSAVLFLGVLFGFAAVAYVLASQGVAAASFTDIDALAETAHDFSVARYEDDYRIPAVARLLLSLNYVAISFSGIAAGAGQSLVWNESGLRRRFLLVLPLVPQVVLAIVMTTRAQVLFEMIVWISFYLASAIYSKDRLVHKIFKLRKILVLSFVGIFVLFLFVALQFLRGGITDLGRLWEILEHLRKWPFGSIAGFSLWFDQAKDGTDLSFGFYTFTGVFDLLGIKQRETGLYLDYVDLGGGAYGNIYSIFRGLIEDFGGVGACIFLFFMGALGGRSYCQVLRSSRIKGVASLAAIYMAIIWSPMVSFFGYFSMVFNIIAVFFAVGFLSRIRVFERSKC